MDQEILIVDDDTSVCDSLSELLRAKGYKVNVLPDARWALSEFEPERTGLALVDLRMPGMGGIELLQQLKSRAPELPVVIITGFATVDTAVTAMKYGATDVFTKPIRSRALLAAITKIMTERSDHDGLEDDFIISEDPVMKQTTLLVSRAAPSDAPVLFRGETGTGKELAARMIHNLSARRKKPWVEVNCAALPDTLLESEMFGHERGAFTDADGRKHGLFETANGGTIFLDEIGEMSLSTQAKMLRVLQDKRFKRLGGVETIYSDCRIVAASNKDLERAIREGRFREDLYYRLAVVEIYVPPLRERPGDIVALANYFLNRYSRIYHRPALTFSPEVTEILKRHGWPGNVRELKNLVERAVIFSQGDRIEYDHLSPQYRWKSDLETANLGEKYSEAAREVIAEALARAGGSKSEAAKILHIDRKTLYNRMKKFNME